MLGLQYIIDSLVIPLNKKGWVHCGNTLIINILSVHMAFVSVSALNVIKCFDWQARSYQKADKVRG